MEKVSMAGEEMFHDAHFSVFIRRGQNQIMVLPEIYLISCYKDELLFSFSLCDEIRKRMGEDVFASFEEVILKKIGKPRPALRLMMYISCFIKKQKLERITLDGLRCYNQSTIPL
jgi:hypothetical protein